MECREQGHDLCPEVDVTRLLRHWDGDDPQAREALLAAVYGELRGLAAAYLRRERRGHTLEADGLVNEAYLRLIDQRRVQWRNRCHFFGIAAQAMRRVLVDHARHRMMLKRGGGDRPAPLHLIRDLPVHQAPEMVALDLALRRLETIDRKQARIVEMRFFGGLSGDEIAEVLGVSTRTVTRHWRMARAWLYNELTGHAC